MRIVLTILLLGVLSMVGCAASEPEPTNPTSMEVYAVLRSVHKCSRISPEIEIENAPANAVYFDVTLEDRESPINNYGGGVWKSDGSGLIPEGALTRHYIGACPPEGTSRSYQYVVKALDSERRLLAIDKYVFEQE